MCGIVFALSDARAGPDPEFERAFEGLMEANKARGPDSHILHELVTPSGYRLRFFSSVLHLRGPATFKQPVVDAVSGDVFLWNGQVFEGLQQHETSSSDTEVLWNRLGSALKEGKGEDAVRDVLAGVEGPWASLYFNASSETLHFSRDPLGRRSLLVSQPTTSRPHLVFASVRCVETRDWEWEEVSTAELGMIKLTESSLADGLAISNQPRSTSPPDSRWTGLVPVHSTLPPSSYSEPLSDPRCLPSYDRVLDDAAEEMTQMLSESVRRRVDNIPPPLPGQARLAVLFSGGIDCTVIALLASSFIPVGEPIDLLNVAFENPRSLANAAAEKSRSGKKKKGREVPSVEISEARIELEEEGEDERTERVYGVPDRLTGREAVAELHALRPDREWRFVEINVPYEECLQETPHVLDLMTPSNTVMDQSLALALYFASRGKGALRQDSQLELYSSTAKVLLSGLGADEQLGGYARHRRAFEQGGWKGVIQEVQLDIDRLPSRNLGRDDRIISSHSVESRYPFLALSFINYLSALPIERKMDLRYAEPRSEMELARGDKMLLRLAARRLGLEGASGRKKRAMQFGSRSAKMEVEDKRGASGRKGWGAETIAPKS